MGRALKEDRIWNKGFTTVTISHSVFAVGVYMLIPTIPLFLKEIGAVESQVGVVVTAFYISAIFTRFGINAVLARIGKKRVVIAGLLLSGIIMSLYGFAESVAAVAVLRVIQGVGLGMASSTSATLVADFLPDSRRGQGVGYFTMGLVVSMTVAPVIALNLRETYGFMPMFLFASVTCLLSAVVMLFIKEPEIVKLEASGKTYDKGKTLQWRNLFDRRLIIPAVTVLLFGLSRSVDMNYISLFAEERKLEYLSLYFVVQTVTMFLIRLIVGQFADKKGRNWVLIPGGVAMLAVMVTLSFANTSAVMLLGAFFSGLGLGILAPNLQVWALSVIEPERRNVASSTFFNCMDIGSAIGASVMGLMAENFGYTAMFRTGACAALMYLIVYIAVGREKRQATAVK